MPAEVRCVGISVGEQVRAIVIGTIEGVVGVDAMYIIGI
jgi:hypothetical protein